MAVALTGMLVIAAIALAATGDPATESAPSPAVAPDPHWKADGCRFCHERPEQPGPIAHERVNNLCWRCHDGEHAPEEVHPVGRTFESDHVVRPEGWPAPDGRLSCITCHDVLLHCHKDPQRPEHNAVFLRDGPWKDRMTFCGTCHVESAKATGRYNPHVMLDADSQPMREACLLCHRPSPTLEPPYRRRGEPALRKDPITLCIPCHNRHIDWFDPGHIGHVLPPYMKERLEKPGEVDPSPEPAGATLPVKVGTRPATEPQMLRLPLGEGDRIVCTTCHNPHQAGLFPASSPLGRGAQTPGNESGSMGLRGMGKGICRACHDK
jgi:hypothetical protein